MLLYSKLSYEIMYTSDLQYNFLKSRYGSCLLFSRETATFLTRVHSNQTGRVSQVLCGKVSKAQLLFLIMYSDCERIGLTVMHVSICMALAVDV